MTRATPTLRRRARLAGEPHGDPSREVDARTAPGRGGLPQA
jgi:hypothetical protein